MKIVLVEFGNESREAEAFKTVGGCRKYMVEEICYVDNECFDIAIRDGSYENATYDIYIRIYKEYELME